MLRSSCIVILLNIVVNFLRCALVRMLYLPFTNSAKAYVYLLRIMRISIPPGGVALRHKITPTEFVFLFIGVSQNMAEDEKSFDFSSTRADTASDLRSIGKMVKRVL